MTTTPGIRGGRYRPIARLQGSGIEPVRVTFVVGSGVGVILLAYFLGGMSGQGVDSYAYWRAAQGDPYAIDIATGAFHYAPPIALLLRVVSFLPWPAFYWVWTACSMAMLAWVGRRWTLALIALPPVISELYHGNIHILLAVVVVLAVRRPALWSIVLLTKITPGISLVWYAVRREWRPLAVALGATAGLSLVSLVIAPGLWPAWIRHLEVAGGLPGPWYLAVPLPLRLGVAFGLTVWGARTDREWVLPAAVAVSLPILWMNGLAVVVGTVPLLRMRTTRPSEP